MSRRRDKKDDEGVGFGWLLAGAAAGVAIVGAAAYGAKKLIDYLDEQEQQNASTNREYEPEGKPDHSEDNQREYDGAARRNSASEIVPQSQGPNHLTATLEDERTPLQHKLEDYYNGYVNISRGDMERAKEVVDDIKAAILRYFKQNQPHLITELKDCGSVVEGLKVIHPDEFDVMIPLHVHPGLFVLQYDDSVPGFYVLKQSVQLESFSQPLEIFLSDDPDDGERYLSPDKLRNYFQSMIQRAINSLSRYTIKSGKKGPSILLEVTYDGDKKTSIDFVPTMVVNEKQVVAKPHPEYLQRGNAQYEKYWRESFSMKEWQILTKLPPGACHKKCLKIVKAVRLNNHSQMGMLSSYIYKTLLLHMLEDTDREEWMEECLSERFVDFLDLLHAHLRKGHLPHRFNPALNLLDQYNSKAIEDIKNYLARVLANNKCAKLLKTAV